MDEFFTFREFMHSSANDLTPSMEDYLEMIFRLSKEYGFTRIHDLANALNVKPSSVSRMVKKIADLGYINYEKYGVVILSDKGKLVGERLLVRHDLCHEFLKILGVNEELLEETEKIEHTLSNHSLEKIAAFVAFVKHKPVFLEEYHKFYRRHFK